MAPYRGTGQALLWFRHHIGEADVSLRRNKPRSGVWS